MAWDVLKRKQTERDWSLGVVAAPRVEVWTPAVVAALLAATDKEISRSASRVIGLMRRGQIKESDRAEFSAFFKKWRGYKEQLDRKRLGEATTVNTIKTFRAENVEWGRRMAAMFAPVAPSGPIARHPRTRPSTRQMVPAGPAPDAGPSKLPLILGGLAAAAGIALIAMGKK